MVVGTIMTNPSVTTSANLIERTTITTTTSTAIFASAISTPRIRPSAFAPRLDAPHLSFNYAIFFGISTPFIIPDRQNPPWQSQKLNIKYKFPEQPNKDLANIGQRAHTKLDFPTIIGDPKTFPTVRDSDETTRQKVSFGVTPKKIIYRPRLSHNSEFSSNTDTDLDNEP